MKPKYSMVIRWSEEDNLYLVQLPEFQTGTQKFVTHGTTYEEAAKNGQEVIELLVENYQEDGDPLPAPDVINLNVELGIEEDDKAAA